MKRLLIFVVVMFSVGVNYTPVSAEVQHKHDSQGMEQAMDQFILAQFTDEMRQAVNDFYKKEMRIQYEWKDKNYDVVEIDQWEKGNELSHPYVIKFTVQTYNANKMVGQLGTDTITFGVSPLEFDKEMDERNLAASKVELLNYNHREPSKEKN